MSNAVDRERIAGIVGAIEPELRELALYIHDNPELGLEEFKACDAQVKLLEKYGFSVQKGCCGYETAYQAVYKGAKPGPKIAMLAEYDALPGLGHGCGHNLIAMVAVGAGIAMREFADEFGAEIYVIGTPAEETWGGKVGMTKEGAFDQLDVVMMAHPFTGEGWDTINTAAMNSRKFEFFGKTAHAAAAPHEGVNALDAVINFFNLVNAFRQQTADDARIHGIIVKGGEAPNIIPDYTRADFYIRANSSAYVEELTEKIVDCARAAALGTGCKLEYGPNEGDFKDTRSNMTLAEIQAQNIEALGLPVIRTNGKHLPGSSDLGDVSYVCPAIQCTFDITGGRGFGAHTVEFTECAASDLGIHNGLEYIKGFTATAVQLMTEPELLKAIKKEFETNK